MLSNYFKFSLNYYILLTIVLIYNINILKHIKTIIYLNNK